jgi:hypothetical protein
MMASGGGGTGRPEADAETGGALKQEWWSADLAYFKKSAIMVGYTFSVDFCMLPLRCGRGMGWMQMPVGFCLTAYFT